MSSVTVPRCVIQCNDENTINELICFCDASGKAYPATVYLRQTVDGVTSVELVFAKVRLAPVKGLSIPRLELLAVVIGMNNELKMPIWQRYVWSDSQCVLSWIDSTKQLSVFVKNRVEEIRSHQNIVFRYVKTLENPADVATRGCDISILCDHELCWHGPSCLCKPVAT